MPYELKEKLCRELEEISRKPEMGAGGLEVIHKLTGTIKNIGKISMLEEGGYSQEDGMDYGRGSSYANRGQHWVRGHYSRDGGPYGGDRYSSRLGGSSNRGNTRNRQGGYSRDGGKDEMKEWASRMENADGTTGPHWTLEQTEIVKNQRGIQGSPLAFWVVMNMIYSDYSTVFQTYGMREKIYLYADMAKAWMNDADRDILY